MSYLHTHPFTLFALDATTRRHKDENGFLHVAASHISKECVSPYYGCEIPGWEERGLEPERIYHGYRASSELARAAATFNGLPLLLGHHAESAENPQKEHRIGSLGTEAAFHAPYLDNDIVITDGDAIARVERGETVQLSAAYRYDPVFSPGMFGGQRYDFIMTNIRGNHVALVEEGRAGADVVVADEKPQSYRTGTMARQTFWNRLDQRGGRSGSYAYDAASEEPSDKEKVAMSAKNLEKGMGGQSQKGMLRSDDVDSVASLREAAQDIVSAARELARAVSSLSPEVAPRKADTENKPCRDSSAVLGGFSKKGKASQKAGAPESNRSCRENMLRNGLRAQGTEELTEDEAQTELDELLESLDDRRTAGRIRQLVLQLCTVANEIPGSVVSEQEDGRERTYDSHFPGQSGTVLDEDPENTELYGEAEMYQQAVPPAMQGLYPEGMPGGAAAGGIPDPQFFRSDQAGAISQETERRIKAIRIDEDDPVSDEEFHNVDFDFAGGTAPYASASPYVSGAPFDEDFRCMPQRGAASGFPYAQDAALIRRQARQDALSHVRSLHEAARDVAPLIGVLHDPLAFDSAESIYGKALGLAGMNPDQYPKSAWCGMVAALRQAGAAPQHASILVQDAATRDFTGPFANLKNISTL